MIKRFITVIVLGAIGFPVMILGGNYYFALITFFLGVAAWEYSRMFGKAGYKVAEPLLIGCVIVISVTRQFFPDLATAALAFSIFAAMTWHLLDYEKGRDQAASDFAITATGIVYVGWLGPYLTDLRNLPGGVWWVFLVLPTIWLTDAAAYFVGSRFGKHPLSPRLSPKKTWEGYWGGVIFGTLSAVGLMFFWHRFGAPALPWPKAAALGAALSILTTLGDLGESMFKRQAGMKDSSNFFPGHGGVFDRIDSWLWGGALGYFLITWFLIKGL